MEPAPGFEPGTSALRTPHHSWSRWWDLNPRPLLYESIALPLSYIGNGSTNGAGLPTELSWPGAGKGNRTPL